MAESTSSLPTLSSTSPSSCCRHTWPWRGKSDRSETCFSWPLYSIWCFVYFLFLEVSLSLASGIVPIPTFSILPLIYLFFFHFQVSNNNNSNYFFFKNNYTHLFLVVMGLCCCAGLFSSVASGSYSFWQCKGFSSLWLLLLWNMGSRACGLQ